MNERLENLIPASGKMLSLEGYLLIGGYQAARKALTTMTPSEVIQEVRKAFLRGRGGAGFPAGQKWAFVPAKSEKPKYVCVNADEGEPGTFKDRAILNLNPHLLIEGTIIASYAVDAHRAFIYIRGEYEEIAQTVKLEVDRAKARGFLGRSIFGTDFDLDLIIHQGAGAYICGEETALLESLEGKRGWPRLKPPFPASVGLFSSPTVINNVETLANVPLIILHGCGWFVSRGLETDGGKRLYSVSGDVRRPGLYELPVGTSLWQLVYEQAGGPPEGTEVKAVIPGGLSAPVLKVEEIDIPLYCEFLARTGSMLGSAGVIVIGSHRRMIDVLGVMADFYAHESCGQCTPCRIGTNVIKKIISRLRQRRGIKADLDLIFSLASGMQGRTLCPMGDTSGQAIKTVIDKFRQDLEKEIA